MTNPEAHAMRKFCDHGSNCVTTIDNSIRDDANHAFRYVHFVYVRVTHYDQHASSTVTHLSCGCNFRLWFIMLYCDTITECVHKHSFRERCLYFQLSTIILRMQLWTQNTAEIPYVLFVFIRQSLQLFQVPQNTCHSWIYSIVNCAVSQCRFCCTSIWSTRNFQAIVTTLRIYFANINNNCALCLGENNKKHTHTLRPIPILVSVWYGGVMWASDVRRLDD